MESLIVFEMKKGRILTFSLKLFSVYVLIMTPSNQSFGGYHMFFLKLRFVTWKGFILLVHVKHLRKSIKPKFEVGILVCSPKLSKSFLVFYKRFLNGTLR